MKNTAWGMTAFLVAGLFADACFAQAAEKADGKQENSVVRVFSVQRLPNLLNPWAKHPARKISGSGVVIAGNRILTNSHVVIYSQQIYVQPHGSSVRIEATVERISPEFDMAVLKLEDDKFFKTHPAIPLATKLPQVRARVTALGYQTGGVGLSTTQGTVSRIEYGPFSYGELGLRLEITASLKPGNSGGPALSDGKMVGLVYAVSTQGNIGYAIAAEEIARFLKLPKDTDNFGKLAFHDDVFRLENPALRAKLKVPDETTGVFVQRVRSTDKNYPLKPGDIITHIGTHDIDNMGMVRIYGTQLNFFYFIQKLAKNRTVPLTVLRDEKSQSVNVPLKKTSDGALLRSLKGQQPEYFVWGPLAFTSATAEVVGMTQKYLNVRWLLWRSPLATRRGDRMAFEGEQLVMLVSVFPHKLIKGFTVAPGQTIAKVNGVKIKNLKHIIEVLRDAKSRFVEFEFAERSTQKLVFDRKKALKAMDQILTDNGIRFPAAPRSLLEVWDGR